jgi:hypothetical protein
MVRSGLHCEAREGFLTIGMTSASRQPPSYPSTSAVTYLKQDMRQALCRRGQLAIRKVSGLVGVHRGLDSVLDL